MNKKGLVRNSETSCFALDFGSINLCVYYLSDYILNFKVYQIKLHLSSKELFKLPVNHYPISNDIDI